MKTTKTTVDTKEVPGITITPKDSKESKGTTVLKRVDTIELAVNLHNDNGLKIKSLKKENKGLEGTIWSEFQAVVNQEIPASDVGVLFKGLNAIYLVLQGRFSGLELDGKANKIADCLLFLAKNKPYILPFIESITEALEYKKVASDIPAGITSRDQLLDVMNKIAVANAYIANYKAFREDNSKGCFIDKIVRKDKRVSEFLVAIADGLDFSKVEFLATLKSVAIELKSSDVE